jgi:DNA-binding response OmpR family regulator
VGQTAKILRVGRDATLLDVAAPSSLTWGYEANVATIREAHQLVRTGRFDLVIISARLAAEQRGDC